MVAIPFCNGMATILPPPLKMAQARGIVVGRRGLLVADEIPSARQSKRYPATSEEVGR